MEACEDCRRCTSSAQSSAAPALGGTAAAVRKLAARCERCGHRLNAHEHGLARAALPGVVISTSPPPRDSALGRLLLERGEYPSA